MMLNIIILAAGKGKRMHTHVPKILHQLGGKPLLQHVVNTAETLHPQKIYVVYGNGGSHVREQMATLPVAWVEQHEQLGTGHAVNQAVPLIPDESQVLVLYGDVPLISKATLQALLQQTPPNGLGILVTERVNPFGYGRMVRDGYGKILAIVEERDATPEQKRIKEINTGIITTSAKNLRKWLPKVERRNNQAEYYLTDIVALAVAEKCPVVGVMAASNDEVQGVNDRAELAQLERYYQHTIANRLMLEGVTIMDPARFDCRGDIQAGIDIVIDTNVILAGKIRIGNNCKIGPNCYLKNVELGNNVEILANSYIEDAIIAEECKIGPFARIRPHTELGKNVHIGNFVEVKNSVLGDHTKANHLTYLGDATIGNAVNVGAGTITCNYDGVNKNRTIIEDGAFIGSGTELIAPVTIGENAYIGAGSTINRDAPPKRLTISRAKQVTIEKWTPPKKEKVK